MWLLSLIPSLLRLSKTSLLPFLKERWKPLLAVLAFTIYSFWVYNRGYDNGTDHVQAKWDKEKAETAELIAKNAADNNILGATLKGNYHATVLGIDNQFNLDNSVSASFGDAFGEGASTSRIFDTSRSGGVSAERARIAAERKAIIDEINGVAKARNLLAKHAKTNTVKLINLQQFNQESK